MSAEKDVPALVAPTSVRICLCLPWRTLDSFRYVAELLQVSLGVAVSQCLLRGFVPNDRTTLVEIEREIETWSGVKS